MYTKKVMKHFRNPKNLKGMKNPDGRGKVGNPVCGDLMECYIKVGKNDKGEEIIKDISVKTFGCVAAISTSDVLCDLARGKTLDEAMKMEKKTIVDDLGGLPGNKVHCSLLAIDAMKKAIEDYRSK